MVAGTRLQIDRCFIAGVSLPEMPRDFSKRAIRVIDYSPEWPEIFCRLRERIWPSVSDFALRMEHVGSTAVAGLAAKPVIDIDIVVGSREEIPLAVTRLAKLGYAHLGNFGIEDREAFETPPDAPAHNLYVCPGDSAALRNHIALRDYLRAQPSDAAAYGRLKKKLAREFPGDIDGYVAGKTEFILAMLAKCEFLPDGGDSIQKANETQKISRVAGGAAGRARAG
jgi:GrpB-like predicted nucleotidyltransferase (UPF0157 family)